MYQIKIYKIEEKTIEENEYEIVGEETNEEGEKVKKYGYVAKPVTKEIETEIYQQKIDKDIDIKKVIDSFNQ